MDSGKIRNKTAIEQSLTTAHGHPDLESTQAARRILAKKGIDWKTGEKITSEKPEPAPEIARLAGVGSTAEIVERLKNGEQLTVETKVKTDAGSAENISIYASRRPDGRFSIVTGRGNGADNLTAVQLKKKLDQIKFENPEESSARFEPGGKAGSRLQDVGRQRQLEAEQIVRRNRRGFHRRTGCGEAAGGGRARSHQAG